MNRHWYHFAGVNMVLTGEDICIQSDRHVPFLGLCEGAQAAYCVTDCSRFRFPAGETVYKNPLFEVQQIGSEYRYLFRDGGNKPYAYSIYHAETGKGEIYHDSCREHIFRHVEGCFKHIALPEVMMSFGRMIFHAALLEIPEGGLLLAGPSGVGKTTQSALWRDCGSAMEINGDRPILYKENGHWYAAGSPYAGSSHSYVNKSVRIAGIAFLCQDSVDCAIDLRAGEAFRYLYKNMVMNVWNRAYMQRIVDMSAELAGEVPCCLMRCTARLTSVHVLHEWLKTRTEVKANERQATR